MDDSGFHDEMRYLPPQPDFGADPLALDEGTAERLLTGRLDPADAPPEYARAAMVLAAVTAPPGPDELAGASAAAAALAAVARSRHSPPAPRRPAVLTKLLSVKVAAAAIAALSLAGVASAATGTLPEPAQRVAYQLLGATGIPSPDDHASDAHGKGSSAHDTTPKGPDASGPAKGGLCRAWQSGQGGEHGAKSDAIAFKALTEAAGGADKIADYCKDAMTTAQGQAQGAAGKGAPPTTVPEQAQAHVSDHGPGTGQTKDSGQSVDHGQVQVAPSSTRPDARD